MINALKMMGAASLAISVTACVNHDYYNSDQYRKPALPIKLDVSPQVIYRIDDHRYVSLENYDHCNGENYYVDTKAGIRTQIMNGNLSQYRGRLSIADASGMNIVIPEAPGGTCGDKGCNAYLGYSTDGGRTFKYKKYMQSGNVTKDSEQYSILVAKDAFYVVKTSEYAKGKSDSYVRKYPLFPGLDFDDRTPYPEGIRGSTFYTSDKPLPNLHTPSGQDRFTCDATIRPSNLSAPK